MSDSNDRAATREAHPEVHRRTPDLIARNKHVMQTAQFRLERARIARDQYRALVAAYVPGDSDPESERTARGNGNGHPSEQIR